MSSSAPLVRRITFLYTYFAAMGSVMSLPTIVSIALIAGGISYGFIQKQPPPPDWNKPEWNPAIATSSADKKKGKKKKAAQGDNTASQLTNEPKPTVVAFPAVVPGSFDAASLEAEPVSRPKPKKKKAKKTGSTAVLGGGNRAISEDAQSESSATAPESSTQVSRPTKRKGSSVIEADGAWTRVEARKRNSAQPTLSDAGIASATGTSSPVAEPTEQQSLNTETNRRTLAEKLLPKPRRTGVEDMVETPDVPTIARVMRVQPRPDEQPATGFSWGDYEDVEESRATADDADGEDEGGWVVKGSRTRTRTAKPTVQPSQAAPESLTKKQRQNLLKRESAKASKAEAEGERLATLAKHKQQLERLRIAEQSASKKKQGSGMAASMDEKGHLVWD
ncbi:hypothetical protein BDW22DRAFT_602005 [Trametopsis cervina]|nr:hypothetical protein BDW22DRAFT_602005 [Trametopsis cervina]